jgi:hypothetical protein
MLREIPLRAQKPLIEGSRTVLASPIRRNNNAI